MLAARVAAEFGKARLGLYHGERSPAPVPDDWNVTLGRISVGRCPGWAGGARITD